MSPKRRGEPIILKGHDQEPYPAVCSADGQCVVTASHDGSETETD